MLTRAHRGRRRLWSVELARPPERERWSGSFVRALRWAGSELHLRRGHRRGGTRTVARDVNGARAANDSARYDLREGSLGPAIEVSAMRKLLTVEDSFQISGRGLVVVPCPKIDEYAGPDAPQVELRLPDGEVATATLRIERSFFSPPPVEPRWTCVLPSASKADVPVGTEIWVPKRFRPDSATGASI